MADIYPPVRQRPALLAFAEALSSASTALWRDDNGDWRIKGKLGFIYTVPGPLHELALEGFQLYCDRETKQPWTWAKKLLCFCAVTQDGNTDGVLFLNRLPTPAEAETIRDLLGVAKRPVYGEEVMAQKRERGRQIGERSAQNRPRRKKPHPLQPTDKAIAIPATRAICRVKPDQSVGRPFNNLAVTPPANGKSTCAHYEQGRGRS
jgi:hypothetical protein